MRELDSLIEKIKLMPEGKEKDYKFLFLESKIKLLLNTNLISKEQANKYFQRIDSLFPNCKKHLDDDFTKSFNYLLQQKERLANLYEKVLLYAKKYKLETGFIIKDIDQYQILDYVIDFFKWLNIDILEIYNELNKNGLIYEHILPNYFGVTYRLGIDKFAVLIHPNCSGIQYLSTLVHEMGHVYYYYFTKENPELAINLLPSECLPKLISKLFITYLKENNLIKKEIIENYEYACHICNLLYMDCSYVINKEKNINKKNNWFKNKLSFDEYKEKSIIKPKLFLNYQNTLRIYENRYSYGTLFSLITHDKFIKDESWGRNFIKEFPMLTRKISSDDLISLFTDDEYINAVNNESERILTKKHI